MNLNLSWEPATFDVAMPQGAVSRAGYVYRGLGMWRVVPGSPKGKRAPTWSLTHLGTGHAVCFIVGDVASAFPIASEIAEAGDWTFDGLYGWKNQFPDAGAKLKAILDAHAKVITRGGGASREAIAREVSMRRASA